MDASLYVGLLYVGLTALPELLSARLVASGEKALVCTSPKSW